VKPRPQLCNKPQLAAYSDPHHARGKVESRNVDPMAETAKDSVLEVTRDIVLADISNKTNESGKVRHLSMPIS